jgi:hypothetical protein
VDAPRRSSLPWAVFGLTVVAALAYGAYATGIVGVGAPAGTEEVEADPSPEETEPDDPAPALQSETPGAREISLDVDTNARLVLVDGVRRDERPLVIAVGPEGATIELVAPDGRVIERRVTAEDDGSELRLPGPGRARRRRSRGMMRSAMTEEPTMMGEPGILRSDEVF